MLDSKKTSRNSAEIKDNISKAVARILFKKFIRVNIDMY